MFNKYSRNTNWINTFKIEEIHSSWRKLENTINLNKYREFNKYMYKFIIIIIIAFVVRVNIINLWINNNKYDLSTFGASFIILIRTLCKSISQI